MSIMNMLITEKNDEKEKIMKTKQEIIEFLKECVNEYGTLDLSGIDTTSFAENVDISRMKVKGKLFQRCQQVQGDLIQDSQQVGGVLISHKLEEDEKWKIHEGYVVRVEKGEQS